MNASGRLNTSKSRGNDVFGQATTGARVSNAYATYLLQRNSPEKFGLIPYGTMRSHGFIVKDLSVKDGHA